MTEKRFVFDSSVAIAWVFPSAESERLYAAAVVRMITEGGWVPMVPELFHIEVAEFLIRRRRTKGARFGAAKLAATIDNLDALGIKTVVYQHSYRNVIEWAGEFHVQAKDAPFIHLARGMQAPIATLDSGIKAAASSHRIPVISFN
jgi:predicted nucleic acid-binding protein